MLALTLSCRPNKSDASTVQEGDTSHEREALPVETLTVETQKFRETFDVPALLQTASEVRVGFESGGRITALTVDEGDTVRRGQLLARVDADIDQARIKLLENQVETAEREYERMKKLEKEGVGTTQQLDQAASALEDAKLNLRQAKVSLGRSTIVSPVSGEISEKYAEKGEFASPGMPLVDIVDGRDLEVEASVPSSLIGAIEKGKKAQIEIPPADMNVEGRIVKIPTAVNSKTRTLDVILRIETSKEMAQKIRPGMRASVTFQKRIWKDAILVPRTAILQGYNRDEAALFTPGEGEEQGRAEIREVQTGPGAGTRVLITKGLSAGDRLIIRGHRSVTGGAPVTAVRHYDSLDDLPSQYD